MLERGIVRTDPARRVRKRRFRRHGTFLAAAAAHMTVAPSCPALLVHADDPFRQSLIARLDQEHFSVTYTADGAEAVKKLEERPFKVILVAVDLKRRIGLDVLR